MRSRYTLSAGADEQTVHLDFKAVCLTLINPTGSTVYIRTGANDIPTSNNWDYACPGNTCLSIAVGAREFALKLDSPPADAPANSNLGTVVTALFLAEDERTPVLGAISFQNLALTPLTSGQEAFNSATAATFGPYDVGAWGGLLAFVKASVGVGQGYLRYDVSDDGATWREAARVPIWADAPFVAAFPRVARYARFVTVAATTGITGVLSIRATLVEIDQLRYLPYPGSQDSAFSIGAGASSSVTSYTLGFGAIQAIVSWATFTPNDTGIVLVETGPTNVGPWRRISRTFLRITSSNATWARPIGFLDAFLRITVTAGTAAQTGAVNLDARNVADQTALAGQLVDITGNANDAQGADTLMGMLRFLQTYTPILGQVSDATNATTIYGQIKQEVALLTAYLPTLGDQTDPENSDSIMGRLKRVAAYLTTYEPTLGLPADAQDSNTLIGKAKQVSAISTAWLPALGSAADPENSDSIIGRLKRVAAYATTYEPTLGLPADVANSNTIMGRLKQIADYATLYLPDLSDLSNLGTYLPSLGLPADADGANTLMGKAKRVAAYSTSYLPHLDQLATYLGTLGLTSATANSDTLMGRTKRIADYATLYLPQLGPAAESQNGASIFGKAWQVAAIATAYFPTIGAPADGRGSASIMGQLKQLDLLGTSLDVIDGSSIYGQMRRLNRRPDSLGVFATTTVVAAATWTLAGVLPAGSRIQGSRVSMSTGATGQLLQCQIGNASPPTDVRVSYGYTMAGELGWQNYSGWALVPGSSPMNVYVQCAVACTVATYITYTTV